MLRLLSTRASSGKLPACCPKLYDIKAPSVFSWRCTQRHRELKTSATLHITIFLLTKVRHSFCTFNYKVLAKLDMDRERGCRHKQLFHLIVSTVVMTRKSGKQRRCRQASKQASKQAGKQTKLTCASGWLSFRPLNLALMPVTSSQARG